MNWILKCHKSKLNAQKNVKLFKFHFITWCIVANIFTFYQNSESMNVKLHELLQICSVTSNQWGCTKNWQNLYIVNWYIHSSTFHASTFHALSWSIEAFFEEEKIRSKTFGEKAEKAVIFCTFLSLWLQMDLKYSFLQIIVKSCLNGKNDPFLV